MLEKVLPIVFAVAIILLLLLMIFAGIVGFLGFCMFTEVKGTKLASSCIMLACAVVMSIGLGGCWWSGYKVFPKFIPEFPPQFLKGQ